MICTWLLECRSYSMRAASRWLDWRIYWLLLYDCIYVVGTLYLCTKCCKNCPKMAQTLHGVVWDLICSRLFLALRTPSIASRYSCCAFVSLSIHSLLSSSSWSVSSASSAIRRLWLRSLFAGGAALADACLLLTGTGLGDGRCRPGCLCLSGSAFCCLVCWGNGMYMSSDSESSITSMAGSCAAGCGFACSGSGFSGSSLIRASLGRKGAGSSSLLSSDSIILRRRCCNGDGVACCGVGVLCGDIQLRMSLLRCIWIYAALWLACCSFFSLWHPTYATVTSCSCLYASTCLRLNLDWVIYLQCMCNNLVL